MTGWIRGKIVYLYLHSAENNYYNCYDVLQTKSNIRGVIGTIFNFVMCCTQNHTFTMSCRQISLKSWCGCTLVCDLWICELWCKYAITSYGSRAGSRADNKPSRAFFNGSWNYRAEPGSTRWMTEPRRAEPSLARLGSFPALAAMATACSSSFSKKKHAVVFLLFFWVGVALWGHELMCNWLNVDDICHVQSLNSLTTAMKEDSGRDEANSTSVPQVKILRRFQFLKSFLRREIFGDTLSEDNKKVHDIS